jgi:cytochrome P450
LCKNPEVQQVCHDSVCNAGKEKIKHSISSSSSDQLQKTLPDYVEATLKESMRKYPTVARGSMRVLVESESFSLPTKLLSKRPYHSTENHSYPDQISIPKGAYVMVNFFALQNSKDIWGEDATEFRPERWLKASSLASPAAYVGVGLTPNEIAFSPFSYGIRNCLGMNMALWEIRAVLSALLGKYRFALADPLLENEAEAIVSDITTKPLHRLPVFVNNM